MNKLPDSRNPICIYKLSNLDKLQVSKEAVY